MYFQTLLEISGRLHPTQEAVTHKEESRVNMNYCL